MSVRSVKHELEAKLTSQTGGLFSRPAGKLERKSYGDNRERLKIILRNLSVPDQSTAVVSIDGAEVVQILIRDGAGRYDNESRDSGAFLALAPDQVVRYALTDPWC